MSRISTIIGLSAIGLFLNIGNAGAQERRQIELLCLSHDVAEKVLSEKLGQKPTWAGVVGGMDSVYAALAQSENGESWTIIILDHDAVCIVASGTDGKLVGKQASN